MTLEQMIERYGIPPETARRMEKEGVIMSQLLTPRQVASRFQVALSNVYKLVDNGTLPARRLRGSRLLRFDPREIEEVYERL